jgi:hypothetical protein
MSAPLQTGGAATARLSARSRPPISAPPAAARLLAAIAVLRDPARDQLLGAAALLGPAVRKANQGIATP